MASVVKFEDLDAWKLARDLAREIYAATSVGGFSRDFVLRDQIRGAAVSVVSNIAEGFERGGNQEFVQFLSIAKGSAGEVRAQLYIALDQGYVDRAAFDHLQELAVEVSGKLGGLMAYLKASGMKGSKYRVDEPGTMNLELGTSNSEPGTLNIEPGTREAGFALPTAIFLIVILAMLGVFIISVTGLQQSSQVLDVQGVRAYQAARAGIEWGAYQTLDPNNDQPGIGGTDNLPVCPASPTNLTGLAQSLSVFTVTVTCDGATYPLTTEGNRKVRAYRITANACNQPTGGGICPNSAPTSGYVERELEAVLSKCKDPSAGPRFSCG